MVFYSKNIQTDNGKLITGYACDSRTADAEFLLAKRQYIAATGRVRGANDVIAYHVRQSFRPGEITLEEANRLGVEFARRFTKENHAFVVCTHIDKSHIHNHIIWSSVSLEYDRKFRNFWGSTKAVRRLSDTICIENGLSIVENPKLHGKSYNKWLGDQAKPSHRELLRVAIDNALSQSPADFEELLKLLQEYGCEVSKRGKSYRLKLSGWEKAARMDSLGEGYGLEDLRAVLLGKKAHTPRKKTVTQAEPPKVNLLVDIQAKLQAGKGAGYTRLITVFNIINSIAMSVSSRSKQYGSFRAIGLSTGQLRKMIVAEAFTYTIIGGIVGTILGLLSNKVLFEMLISYKWGDTWTIPLKELGIILLIVVLSAIVAVYGPIKRIHNMSIVDTISAQ